MDIFHTRARPAKKNEEICVDGVCRMPLTDEERELYKTTNEVPRMSDMTWRVFRIMAEFVEGFQFLSRFNKSVTVFGSARLPKNDHWYLEAVRLGRLLGENGYAVITGGGPGIMEAANKGSHEVGGISAGLNIQLPMEQRINPYVNASKAFHYFFTRKVMLAASAQAYVYFPGGFGTLDELFEILTLIQTKKTDEIPVILVGKSFWNDLDSFIQGSLYKEYDTISKEDMSLYKIVDTAEDAFELIKVARERAFF